MNKPNISVQQGFAQRHCRSVLAAAVLIVLSVVLACLVMTCGNTYYSLAEVWKILTSEGTKGAAFTIKTLRLPKMLIGILAGIAFGMGVIDNRDNTKKPENKGFSAVTLKLTPTSVSDQHRHIRIDAPLP